MPKDNNLLSPSEKYTTPIAEYDRQPAEGAKTFELEAVSEAQENLLFQHFFSGLESFPIAKPEVARILGQSESQIAFYERRGIISRSVENEWRQDINFASFNFFDLYRLAIIQRLYLFSFCGHEAFENLMDEFLDEICLDIDQALCDRRLPKVATIRNNLFFWFFDRTGVWKRFWLLDGEPYDAMTAANTSLWTWITTFKAASREINLFGPEAQLS